MPAHAQTLAQAQARIGTPPPPPTLTLRNGDGVYELDSVLFVTPDPNRTIGHAAAVAQYFDNQTGSRIATPVVPLGSRGEPHWLIFTVRNASTDTDWVLSLGRHRDGRYGSVQQIYLYDQTNQRRLLTAVAGQNPPPPVEQTSLNGAAVPFTLPAGAQATMVLYVIPDPGVPVTLAPHLYTAKAFYADTQNWMRADRLVQYGLMALIAFLIGALLFRGVGFALGLAAYYAANLAILLAYDDVVYTSSSLASETTAILFCASVLFASISTRIFIREFNPSISGRAIIYAVILSVIVAVVAGAFMATDVTPMRTILLIFVPTAALWVLGLAAITPGFCRTPTASILGTAWLVSAIGATVSVASVTGFLLPTDISVNAYWIGLIAQAPILLAALWLQLWQRRDAAEQSVRQTEETTEALTNLRQTKEATENARLLKVIEHERKTLDELRERELQQTEEMRLSKDAADAANRSKSAFLAVVSHEIRTPMTGVMGMVRLLQDTHLTREQSEYARTIQDSGEAMITLLNDILDFEKIESGKMELELVDFDLHRTINSVVTLMSGHATQKQLSLNVEMDESVPRFVAGDPVRLRQVLLNLVGNAIKFTIEGSVTIIIRNEGYDGRLHRLFFAVRDTGAGISAASQKNLFNPFSQADASINRKFGGTGLGLAISQRLIEAMGDRIAIESEEGHGATFYFTIAIPDGQATQNGDFAKPSQENVFTQSQHNLQILCVDDNEVNQKLLREFVARMGHTPSICGSGEEALALVEHCDFDMAFMDIELPGLSGMGVTRAIRAMNDPTKARLPIIALTGNVRDDDIRQCYAANMNGHLTKPIDPAMMKGQIEKVIAGKLDNPVVIEDDTTTSAYAHGGSTFNTIPAYDENDDASLLPGIREAAEIESATSVNFDFEDMTFDGGVPLQSALPPQKPTTAPVVFDPGLLNPLKGSMDQASLDEMIGELLTKIDEIIGATYFALNQGDTNTLRARMHELKGMAGNFGLQELSHVAGDAEHAARDEQVEFLSDIIDHLPAARDRAHATITEWLHA